jgi:hypothetical protein
MDFFGGGGREILLRVGRHSLYKIKSSQLWLVHNPQLQAEVYLKNRDFTYPLPIYLVINITANNQENLQTH